MKRIEKEHSFYNDCPKIYIFADENAPEEEKRTCRNLHLMRNFNRINEEVDSMIKELMGDEEEGGEEGS